MFLEEAIWINGQLAKLDLQKGQIAIDCGSSTEEFRCLERPFIDYYIFRPLRKKGVDIIYIDSREGDGIDIVCDLTDPDIHKVIENREGFDLVFCTSLLEHVLNREAVLGNIKKLAKPGGVIIISVPYRYRRHLDPIDTMYRPSIGELEDLFSKDEYIKIASDVIEVEEEPVIQHARQIVPLYFLNRCLRPLQLKIVSRRPPSIIKNKVSILILRKHGN